MLLLGIVAGAITHGIGTMIVFTAWAGIYNKRYTTRLIKNGYVFSDTPEMNALANAYMSNSNVLPVLFAPCRNKKTSSSQFDHSQSL